ncbi:MAG: hypothetical protein N3F63_01860 [Thermoplasmata archaeon]|nr:hypothetical protein [Thermoplasmata archaeon]
MTETKIQPVHKEKALAAIRKKEAWAKSFLLKTRDESKKYILSAVARSEEIRKRGEAEIRTEIQRLREEKARKLAAEISRIDGEASRKVEVLQQKAKERMETAVNYAINAILEELDALS